MSIIDYMIYRQIANVVENDEDCAIDLLCAACNYGLSEESFYKIANLCNLSVK